MRGSFPRRSLGVAAALLLASCYGDSTAPGTLHRVPFAFAPVFDVHALHAVRFESVRIRLVAAGASTAALDTTVAFPSTADSIALDLTVPIIGASQSFTLTLAMIDAAGDTVFRGGPLTVTALPGVLGPAATDVPIYYSGVGANAASVRFTGTPPAAAFFGDTVRFAAEALDSSGNPIAGTPIVFLVDPRDSALARVPDADSGRVIAKAARGSARVVAQLLTHQSATVALAVQPKASALAAGPGAGQSGVVAAALAQPITAVVTAADRLGVQGVTVSFAVTAGGGSLSAPSAVTDTAGRASVGWTLGPAAGAQTVSASGAGLAPASVPIAATALAGPATSLVFTQAPPTSVSAVSLFGATVAARDTFGNVATGFTGAVSLGLGTNPGSATLLGTTSLAASAGVAAFTGLHLTVAASGYTLVAASAGLPNATSSAINVTTGAPAHLSFVTQPSDVVAGLPVAPPVVVAVRDAAGNPVPTATDTVTLLIAAGPAGATLTGAATVAAVAGEATFAGLTLPKAGAGYRLVPASGAMARDTSAAFTVSPGVAAFVVFAQQPTDALAGAAIAPAVQVAVRDSLGNVVPTYTDTVTIGLLSDPTGDTLSGVKRVAATAGVATFTGLTLRKAATGYALGATAAGIVGPALSASFAIGAGAAAALALDSGNAQSGPPSSLLAQAVVARVSDAFGNPVSGQAVGFAVASGGGSVGTPSAVTDAAGRARSTWTLGATPGPQTVTATAAGLAGSPVTFSANAGGVATSLVAPHRDTLTALGATVLLTAQAKDFANNPAPGTFTWASRTPAVATVDTLGRVTAVANDSTWIVATEAGGTKDSALVVVQQRITTVNVTPGVRSIYLTRSFAFAAAAVDGNGHPVAGGPAFTWASTAPAVATVDAAGTVSAVGLGATQVRATSAGVTGVANVTVLTPITRIVVAVDTAGAASPDSFTLNALGLTRSYRAVAHDTLDAVMGGVAFTWASSNPSVAALDSVGSATARAAAAANGVTSIRASAQGVTSAPAAQLTVAQALASVELKPDTTNPTATIAVAGTMHVSARGKDGNNRYIAGGTFRYHSATPAVAVVDSVTGLATGVSNGTADLTAAGGAITSNVVTVTVGGAVPAIISFGRDTVSVGRGSSTSVPVLLSKPAGSPLTVNLAATAYAHWGAASVVIPAGQTSVNATLVGDSAGTATVTATDGSGFGYAAASAIAKVTANMRLTSSSYGINATDAVTTQVLLSDPSPAGGTYVTFAYGTPGVAATSPDPALIPAGQLAADIQIRAVGAGTTTITPTAIGVNGQSSSFQAYAPVLNLSTASVRLGQGQYEPSYYVSTPAYTNTPVHVTFASSDTTVATVAPTVATIPAGSYYAYFSVSAVGTGTATVSASAPGWTAAGTIAVRATTPHVGICCGGSLYTTSPVQNLTVYAEDSLAGAHYRTNSLVVQLRSSDTTVLKVLDSVVTIAPGLYYANTARVLPGGLGGTAYVVASAGGHSGDSTLYTVLGPPLYLNWSTNRVGAGQEDYNLYVSTPNNVTAPLLVTLANSDSSFAAAPPSVTIPTGSYYAYLTVRGKAPGASTFTATAAGYQSATATYLVTSPRVTACCSGSYNAYNAGSNITAYSTDSLGNAHYRSAPLTVSLASTDTTVVRVDSATVTVDAGTYYVNRARLAPVGIGTAQIVVSAAGHISRDTLTITVGTPKLNVSFYSTRVGRGQHFSPTDFYVYTPDSRAVPVPVTLTQLHGGVDSLSTTGPLIPAGGYYAYFSLFGTAYGTDTIIATASGYLPDTAYVTVTTPRLTTSGLPASAVTTSPPIGLNVYATDSTGNAHYVTDTVVVQAVSSDSTVVRPTQAYVRIPRDAYYAATTVTVVGPGTATITYTDSAGTGYLPVTTSAITVTGPSLYVSNGTPVLGMRQTGGATANYVYVQNTVATPLVVSLASTATRVVTVPATVTIPAGSYYAYFPVAAMDTLGTIQVQATATGYGPVSMNVQVTAPKFVMSTSAQANTTAPRQVVTVYAADANGNTHYTTEAVTVTLASSAPTVAPFDSTTVTIPSGAYYVNTAAWLPGVVGTSQLSASDPRSALYAYAAATANVAVVTPSLSLSWTTTPLGLGQYIDQYVSRPDYPATPLDVTLSHLGTPRVSTLVGGAPVATVQVPASNNYVYFRTVGLAAGTDSLVASATSPLHNADTAYTVVGAGLLAPASGWPSTLAAGDSALITIYARDPAGNARYVAAATGLALAPNGNVAFVSGGASSAVITTATIPADQYYVQIYLKGVSAGPGSASITHADYQTYTNTVTITP